MAERAVSLLSGGLDSATATAIAVAEGYEVHALTIDYGQRHRVEVERARRLAGSLGVAAHRVIRLDLTGGSALTDPGLEVPRGRSESEMAGEIPVTYVPARNTVFLALALGWAEVLEARDVFVGVNHVDYSGYPDCRPVFLERFEALAQVATRAGVAGRRFRIRAPLIEWSKARIVRRAYDLGVDLGSTWSCYDPAPGGRPCGDCDACRLRQRGFAEAGIPDPATHPA